MARTFQRFQGWWGQGREIRCYTGICVWSKAGQECPFHKENATFVIGSRRILYFSIVIVGAHYQSSLYKLENHEKKIKSKKISLSLRTLFSARKEWLLYGRGCSVQDEGTRVTRFPLRATDADLNQSHKADYINSRVGFR